jgi:hypothetical protein
MWSKVKQTIVHFKIENVKQSESWTNTNVKQYESKSLFNFKGLAYKNVKQSESKPLFNLKAELTKMWNNVKANYCSISKLN